MSINNNRYYSSDEATLSATTTKPLTYIEWLQYETSFDRVSAFEQYTRYLSEWYNKRDINNQVTDVQYIKNIYTELLKQITVEYTTPDEKRFLSNIDFENKNDLDVALPFFARKLKQIAIYYSNQREEIKFAGVKANLKGSDYGINQVVYKQVAEIIKYDPDIQSQLADMGLTQQDVLTNLKVEVQELYDTEQNYYNIPYESDASNYTGVGANRYNYFNMSLIPQREKMFLSETFTETVKELIEQVPVIMFSGIESITQSDSKEMRDIENRSYAISDVITGTELDRLNDSQFSNYLSTGQLNIEYEQLAFKKYCGTDYYYLSTGDTLSEVVSSKLFAADNPHKEILNKFYPTILSTSGEGLYKHEYIGGYFTSNNVGILTYTTLDFEYKFKPTETNQTYFFPDPSTGATGFFGADRPFETVVEYYENVNWQKNAITTHYNYGLQKQYKNLTRFTPYQSKSDTLMTQTGVNRSTDEFNFWEQKSDNVWKNPDIYPLQDNYVQPIDIRYDQLLGGNKILYKWKSDIYGNEYALVKTKIEPVEQLPINQNSTIYQTELVTIPEEHSKPASRHVNNITTKKHKKKTLTEQQSVIGELYIRNNTFTGVLTLKSPLVKSLYEKYNVQGKVTYRDSDITLTDISAEITNELIDIDVIYDTIIFETRNYVVFEKITYDYNTSKINSGHNNFSFLKKNYHQNRYEKTSNWWYDKNQQSLMIVKTTVHPELSASTDKMIYPEIFNYDMNTGVLKRTYPDQDLTEEQIIYETSVYSLSSINKFNIIDIDRVKPPRITYNKDSERYTMTQLGYDIADNIFLLKNDFLMYDNTIQAVKPSIYKNNYVIYTLNPANDSIQRTFIYETNPSLTYLSISEFTYMHDDVRNLLFMGCLENRTTGNPDSQPNSSCVFIHGTEPQNMQTNRDMVMCFDFMTCGFIDGDTTAKPNGLSVVFFQARVKDLNLKNAAASEPEYELLDDGGLGPAFTYLDDVTRGTNTQNALSGLDTGHACVALDVAGNVGGNVKTPNNVTVFAQYDSVNRFEETTNVDTSEYNFWSDISEYTDYTELPFIRCKVVLTDLGKRIKVYLKHPHEPEFKLVSNVSLAPAADASKVFYNNKIYKCLTEHTSSVTTNIEDDTRVSYNGTIYRCVRGNTATATETPDSTPFFWKTDNQWPHVTNVTPWSSGTTYTASNWLMVQSYAPEPGDYDTWDPASKKYYSEYQAPDRLKMALASNTSAANPGLTVIRNITVTGAGNNT